jgi:adenylyl- and sulfurtransferase ThiI
MKAREDVGILKLKACLVMLQLAAEMEKNQQTTELSVRMRWMMMTMMMMMMKRAEGMRLTKGILAIVRRDQT